MQAQAFGQVPSTPQLSLRTLIAACQNGIPDVTRPLSAQCQLPVSLLSPTLCWRLWAELARQRPGRRFRIQMLWRQRKLDSRGPVTLGHFTSSNSAVTVLQAPLPRARTASQSSDALGATCCLRQCAQDALSSEVLQGAPGSKVLFQSLHMHSFGSFLQQQHHEPCTPSNAQSSMHGVTLSSNVQKGSSRRFQAFCRWLRVARLPDQGLHEGKAARYMRHLYISLTCGAWTICADAYNACVKSYLENSGFGGTVSRVKLQLGEYYSRPFLPN